MTRIPWRYKASATRTSYVKALEIYRLTVTDIQYIHTYLTYIHTYIQTDKTEIIYHGAWRRAGRVSKQMEHHRSIQCAINVYLMHYGDFTLVRITDQSRYASLMLQQPRLIKYCISICVNGSDLEMRGIKKCTSIIYRHHEYRDTGKPPSHFVTSSAL